MRTSVGVILAGLVAASAASELYIPARAHEHRDLYARKGSKGKRSCKRRMGNVRIGSSDSQNATSVAVLFTPTPKSSGKPSLTQAQTTSTSTTSIQTQPPKVTNAGFAVGGASSSIGTSLLAASKDFTGTWLKRNCAYWGWYPADFQKLGNGQMEYPTVADQVVGTNAKYFGMYAHMYGNKYKKGDASTYFDGSEILHWTGSQYLQNSNAIPVLSVMPVYGFGGMTKSDNTQAVALAKVVKHFADAGLTPYLRWGHEMNWYFEPNSDDDRTGSSFYVGSAAQYIESWQVVHDTVKAMVPTAKMFWCPIRAWDQGSNYAQYWPGASYVDVVGVDYYPSTTGDFSTLAKYVQDIHDTYAKANGYPFLIGETGSTEDAATKLKWAGVVTSTDTCSSLTNLVAVMWFDMDKDQDGGDFRLLAQASTASKFASLMSS